MSPADVARALRGRRFGRGKWMAKCPVHREKTGSLSITDMGQGKTRLHCFGGCDQADVLRAAGLSWKDLRPGDVSPEMRNRLSAGERLEKLQWQHAVMHWLAVIEPERRRYWQAGMRRVIAEMEPLYWEVMPDLEKVERATQFEIDDYRAKRLDWLYRRHDAKLPNADIGTELPAREIRSDSLRSRPPELPPGGVRARREDDQRNRGHVGRSY